jgi:hypothetical protein
MIENAKLLPLQMKFGFMKKERYDCFIKSSRGVSNPPAMCESVESPSIHSV